MQMVKRFLWTALLVWVAVIVFMPKEELYFKLERELATQGIELNEASIEEGLFGLTLYNVTVYAKGIPVAHIKEADLFTLLVYTRLSLHDLDIDESFASMLPKHADKITVTQTLISPLHLTVEAEGSFGKVHGDVSLKERKLHLVFTEIKELGALKSSLKQDEKGWYYETAF